MIYYKNYVGHLFTIEGVKNKVDTTIYTFDIETSSYIVFNKQIFSAFDYLKFNDKEKESCEFYSNMYIWQLSINDQVYYGRTWEELQEFIKIIDKQNSAKKIIFVHNLSFEFQYLKSYFNFEKVFARKSRKPIYAKLKDYNIEFRCSYFMSNVALEELPKMFLLPIEKLSGNLDYTLLRHSKTNLTKKEFDYCENDCLVLYYYIKELLKQYEVVNKIPYTNTGQVRREFKKIIENDYEYKKKTRKAININPLVYNMLIKTFQGRLYTCKFYI